MGLKKGDKLPQFTLPDQEGQQFSSNSLAGQAAVIYFYPKNFTPGCTKEACAFRDAYEDFAQLGARVLGISTDSDRSHRRFAERYDLPFTLLSDKKGVARKLFGVKRAAFGLLPGRETFVFDKEGQLIFRFNSMDPGPHVRKALQELKALQ